MLLGLHESFSSLKDPRVEQNKKHKLRIWKNKED
jgi:hypothetical protein